MTPLRLSYIWYRRLYVALFIGALGYIILYALPAFDLQYIPEPLTVNVVTAAASVVVAIASSILFVLAKRITSFLPAFLTYLVFAIATAFLVQSSGGVNSSFLPLWSLVIFFSPVFGAYGWLPGIVITGTYIAGEYLTGGLPTQTLVLVGLSSVIPLAAGVVLWRETSDSEDAATKDVKHLASQLSEVATKSEIVINAIGDGVIAVDGTGVVQLINPAAQEILGWGKQDAMMLNYKSILQLTDETHKELDPALDPIQQVLNTNQQSRGNKLLVTTNSGKKISVSLVASPIGDTGSGAIAVFRDITNERAEEREQAEFISTASHEMRTPVASIEGYLGLVLNPNTATVDQRGRDFVLKAHEAAQHLGRLFQDLLDVSKSEDGRMANVPKVVDIVPFTQTIVQGLTQKAADKGLQLTFVPGENGSQGQGVRKLMPVYYVNLDNDHIREVLDNLIENAIKYTPQGEVRVDVTGTEDKVVVSIKDTGLGIPAEDIPHLFQKFYRVENVDRQSIGGTGLGLYLCRRLIEAMQGRLWVESTFGSGSTFFVELPRIDTQEATMLKERQDQQAAQAVVQPPVATFVQQPPTPATPQAPTKSIPVTYAQPVQASAPVQAAPVATAPLTQPQTQATAPQVAPQPQQVPIAAPVLAGPPPAMQTQSPQSVAPQYAQPQQQAPLQPAPQPQQAPVAAKPATTVPRGETLTREQINERVRQLEALAQQQRGSVTPPTR